MSALQDCVNEIGALTIPLGEKYGGTTLLLAMCENVAYALRMSLERGEIEEKHVRMMLEKLERSALNRGGE